MNVPIKLFCHTDVGLQFRQQPNHTAYYIQDNSILRLAALGTLHCITPYRPCCQNRGHWHYPNESVVPTSQDGSLIFTSRTDRGRLDLQRRAGFSHESADGVYECQIPDEKGIAQTFYTWIYSGTLCELQLCCIKSYVHLFKCGYYQNHAMYSVTF